MLRSLSDLRSRSFTEIELSFYLLGETLGWLDVALGIDSSFRVNSLLDRTQNYAAAVVVSKSERYEGYWPVPLSLT